MKTFDRIFGTALLILGMGIFIFPEAYTNALGRDPMSWGTSAWGLAVVAHGILAWDRANRL